MPRVFVNWFSKAVCARFRSNHLTDVKRPPTERFARANVTTALALLPMTLLAPGAPLPEVVQPFARVQLAAESREAEERFEQHFDSEELPSSAHPGLNSGQKRSSSVTAPPSGYDAKHLNRLWSRFHGAKVNTKAGKRHK